ncbi:hypothetical protein A3A60_02615 [Candidatus Curtissbacteria bacterium RIFCSPLOWO2_01_FULL_42_26]|uniref:Translation elongation factor-like protein n=1 Tax=Candidatus Curtissbacteria bacterium RIFCSPLOWO2_01_FULL_42_26 TaxID=1797729 RepID=A0A1F5I349_9BACT|nr:MAG: hypothetical protein A3A60_02615 [Candidatus Curtissbacteria bacterium RIFCSPLOWO2_01_FULL_42_26]
MADLTIGKVTHYFDKIQVAVIKITKGDLQIGDTIKLQDKEGKEFTQKVSSMQIEHATIEIAKAGDEFGLKVQKEIKNNTPVVKAK